MGQAGFLIKSGSMFIGIDLYLSDTLAEKYQGTLFPHTRMMDPPCGPSQLKHLDVLLSTHGHTDHMDMGTLQPIYAEPSHNMPLFICPRAEVVKAHQRHVPLEKIVGINNKETYAITKSSDSKVIITAIPAAHEELKTDAWGNYLYLGYVIEIGNVRIFHSGDGIPYVDLVGLLKTLEVDIALLPVNGRDAYRSSHGVPGNFTIDEAIRISTEASIPMLIVHHVGLFDFNTVAVEELEYAIKHSDNQKLKICIPTIDTVYSISFVSA